MASLKSVEDQGLQIPINIFFHAEDDYKGKTKGKINSKCCVSQD